MSLVSTLINFQRSALNRTVDDNNLKYFFFNQTKYKVKMQPFLVLSSFTLLLSLYLSPPPLSLPLTHTNINTLTLYLSEAVSCKWRVSKGQRYLIQNLLLSFDLIKAAFVFVLLFLTYLVFTKVCQDWY